MKDYFSNPEFNNISNNSVKNQLSQLKSNILLSLLFAFMIIIGVYILSLVTNTPPSDLSRDPSTFANSKFYLGIFSIISNLVWAATTGICFFGAFTLKGNLKYRREFIYLLLSGFLSLTLTLDDALQLHEYLFPSLLQISEKVTYLGYFIIVGIYILYFWRRIFQTDFLLLIFSILFFALSMLTDMTIYKTFIKDSLKFTGIVFFLTYFSRTTAKLIKVAMWEFFVKEIRNG